MEELERQGNTGGNLSTRSFRYRKDHTQPPSPRPNEATKTGRIIALSGAAALPGCVRAISLAKGRGRCWVNGTLAATPIQQPTTVE